MMNSPQISGWQVLATKRKLMVSCVLGLFFLAIGMDIRAELGARNNQRKMSKRDTTSTPAIWQPAAGVKWQIQLVDAVEDTTIDADIWDIDLFDNTVETITTLQNKGHKVICYFSAGTYEDWRPDISKFDTADFGSNLDEWPGERWLNIKSSSVREIMSSRLDMANQKGCDGVDPDNIDAYGNENGLGLTEADSIDFLTFLASESHSRGMSIGLKNGGDIIGSVIDKMQWSVNEQCAEYDEFNKPVFHIEYSGETIESGGSDDTSVSAAETATDSKTTSTSAAIVTPASSSSAAATATATATSTTTVNATPVSTSAAATATSTDAVVTKTGSTDTDGDDEEDGEEDEDEDEDEDNEEDDEEDEDEDDDEDNEEDDASADASKEQKHRYGHGHHKLRARAVLSSTLKSSACNAANADKFSTVIKNMNLDAWVEYC
ncbi:unnamed protein product [Penicillium discolor]